MFANGSCMFSQHKYNENNTQKRNKINTSKTKSYNQCAMKYTPCYAFSNSINMTELDLYKFIEESGSLTEFNGETATIWVYHFNVDDFVKLIGTEYLEEGGIEVRLQEDYIAVDITEMCKDNDINLYAVLKHD